MNDLADERRSAPATQRNREAILAVLARVLPATGTVLEIASGTGEHAVFFAPRLASRFWLPSDPEPTHRASIAAWAAAEPAANLRAPIALDAAAAPWPVEAPGAVDPPISAIVNANMIHISPRTAGLGLLAGAGRVLPPGGVLYLYGPFMVDGSHTAPSNAAFDASLRSQDPTWGVRDLTDVSAAAADAGLGLVETVAMPANNLSVVFRRQA